MSDSVRPRGRQPTRLPHPWDSPGKNTGVGCHFLLQCMKVKSESEVAQSCLTLSDPMDCSPPGPSVHGIFQASVLEWGAIAFSDIVIQGPPNSRDSRPTFTSDLLTDVGTLYFGMQLKSPPKTTTCRVTDNSPANSCLGLTSLLIVKQRAGNCSHYNRVTY